MPSSNPEYEYDVFISYRQKDNKYDGWVTEFIANLRKELEATFKEDIHIYSDENSFDGLHEMHVVKESLSSKLKCLIFMPIISQTYCDPKCYAWTNEFLVFKKTAAAEPLGLKVKLPNGNVTSRIVPVRIHDLDAQDRALLEKEMEGPLRSIDFIFSATGVNRPLRAQEDHPHGNQNKTYYRDQINKVANLVKEIVLTLKGTEPKREETGQRAWTTPLKSSMSSKRRVIAMMGLLILALALVYFEPWNKLNSEPTDIRASIAILPLKIVGDPDVSQPLAEGVTDVIRSNLSMFQQLKVKSRTSVEKYRTSQQSIPEIGEELDVLYVLEGSVQRVGDQFRLVVQLVDARADHQIWSKQYSGNFSNLLESQRQISESIANSLKASITPQIASRISGSTPTSSFEAYDLFIRAKQASRRYERSANKIDLDLGIRLMEEALKMDNRFAQGYAWLAGLKMIKNQDVTENDSSFLLAHRALELDSTVAEASMVLSELYTMRGDDAQALRYTYDALKTGVADSASAFRLIKRLGSIYARVGELDVAIYLFDAVLPSNQNNLEIFTELFYALAASHRLDKLAQLGSRVRLSFPESDLKFRIQAHLALERKDYKELENILSQRYGSKVPEAGYDAYDLIYAFLLRKGGQPKDYEQLMTVMDKDTDSFWQAQLLLIRQHNDEGLRLLLAENIGWYTLTLCELNPIFESVRADPLFKEFMDRNALTIGEKRERIRQLEDRGYLQNPRKLVVQTYLP